MSESVWRYIADDGVSPSFGLASDECLAERVGGGESAPVLRLYTYRTHCALVGRFQNVASEVDEKYCESAGIPISRRPTGGGAIIMGENQLGMAIVLPEQRTVSGYEQARALFNRYSEGVVRALAQLGIEASYRGKNDIEVRGKKIAGLGIYFHPGGGLLFHTSLLVDLDIALMLRVLRTPLEKISDKAIDTVAGRITTVRREIGRSIETGEVRELVRNAYAGALGATLQAGAFTDGELARIRELEAEKYAAPSWIDQSSRIPDMAGTFQVKTEAGLLGVSLSLAGESIKAIYITGDFFADEQSVATVERALRWSSSNAESVARTLRELEKEGVSLPGISPEILTGAVIRACAHARELHCPQEEIKPRPSTPGPV